MAGASFLSKYSTEACNHKEVYSNSLSLTMWKIKRKKTNPLKTGQAFIEQFQMKNKNKNLPQNGGWTSFKQMKNKTNKPPQNGGQWLVSKWKMKIKTEIPHKTGVSAHQANEKKKKKNPQKNGDKCSLNSSKWKKKLNQSWKNWPSRGHGQWTRPSFSSGVVMWHCGDTWMAVGFNVVVVVHIAVVGK